MKKDSDRDLLQAIFNEMQDLKKALAVKDERRVGVKEFAERLNFSTVTLWDRINKGLIAHPLKDGKLNYWLNSYVNEVIAKPQNNDNIAA